MKFGLAVGVCIGMIVPAFSLAQVFTLTKDQLIEYTAQNPFERFPDGRPKVPDSLIARARGMSAEEVWAILPVKNFRNQYEGGFRVLHPGKKLVGARVHCAVHADPTGRRRRADGQGEGERAG